MPIVEIFAVCPLSVKPEEPTSEEFYVPGLHAYQKQTSYKMFIL